MSNLARKPPPRKPKKPDPEYPLYAHDAHATGRWAKRIRGKIRDFGPWRGPESALQIEGDRREDLHAGRIPRAATAGITIQDSVHVFLTTKRRRLDSGAITLRTFAD